MKPLSAAISLSMLVIAPLAISQTVEFHINNSFESKTLIANKDFEILHSTCFGNSHGFSTNIQPGNRKYGIKKPAPCNKESEFVVQFNNGQKLIYHDGQFTLYNFAITSQSDYCIYWDDSEQTIEINPLRTNKKHCFYNVYNHQIGSSHSGMADHGIEDASLYFSIDNKLAKVLPSDKYRHIKGQRINIILKRGMFVYNLDKKGIQTGEIKGYMLKQLRSDVEFKFSNGQTVTFLYPRTPEVPQIIIDDVERATDNYCITTEAGKNTKLMTIRSQEMGNKCKGM